MATVWGFDLTAYCLLFKDVVLFLVYVCTCLHLIYSVFYSCFILLLCKALCNPLLKGAIQSYFFRISGRHAPRRQSRQRSFCLECIQVLQVHPILSVSFLSHTKRATFDIHRIVWSVPTQSPEAFKVLNTLFYKLLLLFSFFFLLAIIGIGLPFVSVTVAQCGNSLEERNQHLSDSGEDLDSFLFSSAHYHLLVKVKRKVNHSTCFSNNAIFATQHLVGWQFSKIALFESLLSIFF